MDMFAMPPVEWQGEPFDCFLLCVDRLSGWTLARPSTKLGLTGEKAAHLMLDAGWGEWAFLPISLATKEPNSLANGSKPCVLGWV